MMDEPERRATSYVVVGVHPGQPDSVVQEAAYFAAHFRAELVCAYVDTGRYPVDEKADGSVSSVPFDPDLPEWNEDELDPALAAQLSRILDGRAISWSVRLLAGEAARALGHVAEKLDAAMIVVGTRNSRVRGGVQEFFGGSVAVHLAHRQHRPVVVIPLDPVGADSDLPWESR